MKTDKAIMQDYMIFNKQNKIIIAKQYDSTKIANNTEIINCDSKLLEHLDMGKWLNDEDKNDKLIIGLDDVSLEEIFEKMKSQTTFVKAGGGIVENEFGELLFMYRNGHFDLPKGHWEEGETIIQTAKREVLEECGMKNLQVGEFLACSLHSYTMHRRRELKQTHWYKMFCSKEETLKPQTEEGITFLRWINPMQVNDVLKQSYPNIQHLFSNIDLIQEK